MKGLLRACVSLSALLPIALAGCTVYPEHKTPTLATTTSAEQTQRIFWKDVEAGKWTEVKALLSPNVVWRAGDRVLERDAIVPWLQGLGVRTALVADTTVKSNVNDMTLVYMLQVKARGRVITQSRTQPGQAAAASTDVAGCLQNLQAVAVWQQGRSGSYLLTVEDLTVGDAGAMPGGTSACPAQ